MSRRWFYCLLGGCLFCCSSSRGVVAVSMDLLQLDINQCPAEFYEPNAFKSTNKCDERTSYVSIN